MVNPERVRVLRGGEYAGGAVAYWMQRDQRASDNWALLYARELALLKRAPVAVVFCLAPSFLGAGRRQYGFMCEGLRGVELSLRRQGIPFFLCTGSPAHEIPAFVSRLGVRALVTDFNPLRVARRWREASAAAVSVPFYEVDAHNIVPCWSASPKREYGARTFRPKLAAALPLFMEPFPSPGRHPFRWPAEVAAADWDAAERTVPADAAVSPVRKPAPGEGAARRALADFLDRRLTRYASQRNDPATEGTSRLSSYLHFGQLSAQRVALEAAARGAGRRSVKAFLEELIVRRELADNFCHYAPDYDRVGCFPAWARETLDKHRRDRRPYRYSLRVLEEGRTHDELWNAAQREMVGTGAMHGYLRMYWGKKLLEWSQGPEEALDAAIYLNDRYELDGRDPNGYAGIAWCIGGVHDRPWPERPVFGSIRAMSYRGCRAKFSISGYLARVERGA